MSCELVERAEALRLRDCFALRSSHSAQGDRCVLPRPAQPSTACGTFPGEGSRSTGAKNVPARLSRSSSSLCRAKKRRRFSSGERSSRCDATGARWRRALRWPGTDSRSGEPRTDAGPPAIERLLRRYLDERSPEENLRRFFARHSDEAAAFGGTFLAPRVEASPGKVPHPVKVQQVAEKRTVTLSGVAPKRSARSRRSARSTSSQDTTFRSE